MAERLNETNEGSIPGRGRDVRRISAVIETLSDLVVVVDAAGLIRYASQASNRLLHRPASFLIGQPATGLVHPDDRRLLQETLASLGPAHPQTSEPVELRLSHVSGAWVDVAAMATDLRSNTDVGGIVLELRDIRPQRDFEESLRHRAEHDPLTGLANRNRFKAVLDQALTRAQHTPTRPHALLFMDLDGFKRINDSLGHAVGDEVLAGMAERLRTRVRPGDTASRLGGDEFAILLENSSGPDAEIMAGIILEAVRQPYRVEGKELVISASVGIALSGTGSTPEELLRDADVAMYEAKKAGKARYQLFRPEMQVAARRRLELEADLRRAVEDREFVLHFQPIVELATGQPVGAEVLVRWQHPTRGLLAPGEFIAASEESGIIVPLGRWIITEALHQTVRWHVMFPRMGGTFGININISVRQIEDDRFIDDITAALGEAGLDPSTVTLEITESLILHDFDRAVARLEELKGSGIKVAIDDFGTGYSSLRYLKKLPVDELKIDKSFIDDVALGPESGAVALAVIKLARTFGMATLAEGIEHPSQVDALVEMGAELGQGYHFARPMPVDAMERYLADRFR